jgi:hypothetical protein
MDEKVDDSLSCTAPNTFDVDLKACKSKPPLSVCLQTVNTIMLMKFSLASRNFSY